MVTLRGLDTLSVSGKTVLLRADLNVPMNGGRVADTTRIQRLLPTLKYLIGKKARVVILSHFDRPGGKFVPSLSLAPLVDALSSALGGKQVHFGVDCVGPAAQDAVKKLKAGEVVLLENLRFHAEEEKGNARFAEDLAHLGDVYVNDAFSCSHRAHASITGITEYLPSAAGYLMCEEVEALGTLFNHAEKPTAAIIGGAKVSSKIELLNHLVRTMDTLIVGGAMANTFLYAKGMKVGKSLHEPKFKAAALKIIKNAEKRGCKLLLPVDLVVANEFVAYAPCSVVDVKKIPAAGMALDIGPESVQLFSAAVARCKTVVWNGPMGAFETHPFDTGTVSLARTVAALSAKKKIRSIAGGGDTISALSHAGLAHSFTYLSTAGGAFLEWLEGKYLPGITPLRTEPVKRKKARA